MLVVHDDDPGVRLTEAVLVLPLCLGGPLLAPSANTRSVVVATPRACIEKRLLNVLYGVHTERIAGEIVEFSFVFTWQWVFSV